MQRPPTEGASQILYVNHVGEVSGAERSMLALIDHLRPGQYEAVLAAPMSGALCGEAAQRHLRFEHLPPLRLRRHPASAAMLSAMGIVGHRFRLGGIVQRVSPAIVHANSIAAGLSATTFSPGMPPIITHVRDLAFPPSAMQWVASGSHTVIAISECVRQAIIAAAPLAADKVKVIHNGIDAESFRPRRTAQGIAELRRLLRTGPDELLIGNIGQLVPWKRQDLFLETAAEIVKSLPNARFAVVGADLFGEQADYVDMLHERANELGIGERVIWVGYRDDIADIMAAMDLVLHTAEHEPLGRVILEAMCVGTPVVAVDANGPAEIIEANVSGLLGAPEPRSLAMNAVRVLSNGVLAENLVRGARERIVKEFSAEGTAKQVQFLYMHVTAQSRLRRPLI